MPGCKLLTVMFCQCTNKAIHVLLMHGILTLRLCILGPSQKRRDQE